MNRQQITEALKVDGVDHEIVITRRSSMGILQRVRAKNYMNEVVRIEDAIANNPRITTEKAVRGWDSNIRLNSLLEVVMETVDAVDKLEAAAPADVDSDLTAQIQELRESIENINAALTGLTTLVDEYIKNPIITVPAEPAADKPAKKTTGKDK